VFAGFATGDSSCSGRWAGVAVAPHRCDADSLGARPGGDGAARRPHWRPPRWAGSPTWRSKLSS
jgi:hypothetical protein